VEDSASETTWQAKLELTKVASRERAGAELEASVSETSGGGSDAFSLTVM